MSDAHNDRGDEEQANPADMPADPVVPTLREPQGGIPPLCETQESLLEIAARFASGTGPIALDAERASGHRYGQRAFLVQAKRAGAGIALLDSEALGDLGPFAGAVDSAEWVLHSATQDLACLAEVGLRPTALFDTELAARLLNLPKVGLASLTETLLGWHLAKGHSASDWSIRPLPEDYLRYAALDVELLLDLRDLLEVKLQEAGKLEWAQQEFEALLQWVPRTYEEPWRRTAGSSRLHRPRNLAVLRALWLAREELASRLDIAPGRVLHDSALVAAAERLPPDRSALLDVPGFKRQQRRLTTWWGSIRSALDLPSDQLPALRADPDGPPHPRTWASRLPDAAERFGRARATVLALAQELDLPPEVLIAPDSVRRLAWSPPDPLDEQQVETFLSARGARPWQVGLVAGPLAAAVSPKAP